jgi:hypothetical protein
MPPSADGSTLVEAHAIHRDLLFQAVISAAGVRMSRLITDLKWKPYTASVIDN